MMAPEEHADGLLTWSVHDLESMEQALDAFQAALDTSSDGGTYVLRARLLAEELLVNALVHGPAGTPITLILLPPGPSMRFEVRQVGPVFDPTDVEAIPAHDPDRVGGQGLRLLHLMSVSLGHRYEGGENIVSVEL